MKSRPPRYSKHSSGQARVRISGQVHYLGPYGSDASLEEYSRLIDEWRQSLRKAPRAMTVRAVCVLFMKHARQHYRKNGKPTSEQTIFRVLLRRLVRMFGGISVGEFGPLKLKRLRDDMIADGWTRKSINKQINRIRSVIAWAISEELVRPDVLIALKTVSPLKAERSDAAEKPAVRSVEEADINAALPHVSRQVSAMIRLQLLTGCRPDEMCSIRPVEIDRTSDVWAYVPATHKNAHHEGAPERVIYIGPRGQAVLQPFLDRPADAYCFSPAEAEVERRAAQRMARKSKVQPSQRDRSKANAKRKPRNRYDVASYRRAISRACKAAGIDFWAPNRLRHSRLTELEKSHDMETARVVGGHTSVKTTRIYVETDRDRARAAMAEVG